MKKLLAVFCLALVFGNAAYAEGDAAATEVTTEAATEAPAADAADEGMDTEAGAEDGNMADEEEAE